MSLHIFIRKLEEKKKMTSTLKAWEIVMKSDHFASETETTEVSWIQVF